MTLLLPANTKVHLAFGVTDMRSHVEVPDFEVAAWRSFFARHLGVPRGYDIDTEAQ